MTLWAKLGAVGLILVTCGPISGLWLWLAHRSRKRGRGRLALFYLACIPVSYVVLAALPGLMWAAVH